jgi:long-chain acyl-CoA synthetase
MTIARTFDLLARYLEKFPDKPDALVSKEKGEWVKYSSADYIHNSNNLSYALIKLGFKKGDKIATISNNRPEWNFVDMGMAQLGIIHVPIFATLDSAGYKHILNHAEVKAVFVSDKYLAKTIEGIKPEVPLLNWLYSFDELEGITHWKTLLELGKLHANEYQTELESIKAGVSPDDCLTLIYTSGTTGTSKGVLLSHRNLLSNSLAAAGVFNLKPEHRYLSILPICHVGERMANYQLQYSGVSIYYAESIASVAKDLQAVQPHGFGAVPRILEKVFDKIMDKGTNLKGVKKKLFFWALDLGYNYKIDGENGVWYEFKLKIANKLIFSKWREVMGNEVLHIGVGGAALQPKMERVFWAAGIKLINMYGLTETSPIITINRNKSPLLKLGSVGSVIEDVELKIDESGEILCKGPNVMLGYYKDEQATREAFTPDGYFKTGDIGILEEGIFLRITDRKKEIFKLSNGKYVAPAAIENLYKESIYIDQLIVVGEGEKYASAIVSPNFEALKNWAKENGIASTDKTELIQEKKVLDLFHQISAQFNKSLGSDEKLKRIRIVADEWAVASGELSPTLKLKRKVLMNKYKSLIGELFHHELAEI